MEGLKGGGGYSIQLQINNTIEKIYKFFIYICIRQQQSGCLRYYEWVFLGLFLSGKFIFYSFHSKGSELWSYNNNNTRFGHYEKTQWM